MLDASVALTWLLRNGSERDATEAFAWLARLKEAPAEAVMPAIGFLEVANVIARAEARGLHEMHNDHQSDMRAMLAEAWSVAETFRMPCSPFSSRLTMRPISGS